MKTFNYSVELTDTFGGEANYSWVKRASVTIDSLINYKSVNRQLMRKAKAAMGLTGIRGKTVNYGDMIEFRPYGLLQVMFISSEY